MKRRSFIILAFVLLTVANITVFIFRDHFQFQDYQTAPTLYENCDKSCVEKWRRYVKDYPAGELVAAGKITDTLVRGATLDTKEKIFRLGIFIYNRFHSRMGRPTPELLRASPMEQFRMLSANDTLQVWCGNLAQLFGWFCWSQDITCRTIEIMKEGDHHVISECFLPETGKWTVIDLTHNILMTEIDHKMVGYAELRGAGSVKAWRISGHTVYPEMITDTGFFASYYHPAYPAYYYYRIDNESVYTPASKLKRYVLPIAWYAVLDEKGRNNYLFYLKDVLLLLWLVSFFVYITSRTKFRT